MCWHQNARRGRSRTGAQARALHERVFGAHKEGSLVYERELVHERYIGVCMAIYGLRLTVGLVIQSVWAGGEACCAGSKANWCTNGMWCMNGTLVQEW